VAPATIAAATDYAAVTTTAVATTAVATTAGTAAPASSAGVNRAATGWAERDLAGDSTVKPVTRGGAACARGFTVLPPAERTWSPAHVWYP